MDVLNITLLPPSSVQHVIFGSFSQKKAQEIFIARNNVLELIRPGDDGTPETLCTAQCFDYIAVGSDSGRLVILAYDNARSRFKKVHEETFGRSGCRRIVPGQYVAADAKGRALMVAATEKQKLVYILNRDASANLTISSPLEAHKSNTLCYDVCGLDVGYDNPVFACIEVDYRQKRRRADSLDTGAVVVPDKVLTLYELDLGLNHVVRRHTEVVPASAHSLVGVPGVGDNGPGGVLVCAENELLYMNQGHATVRSPFPRRQGSDLSQPLLIAAHCVHKQKKFFFFLMQSELGDVYKVTLAQEGQEVKRVEIHYFDTLPRASALAVLKSGFLFLGSQGAPSALYQFQSVGDTSGPTPETFALHDLEHLVLAHQLEGAQPAADAVVAAVDSIGDTTSAPQVVVACGQGSQSSLAVLRHGVAVGEVAVAELEATPQEVWTARTYLVMSFANATLVLDTKGDAVEEVSDSGILADVSSLHVGVVGNSIVQVHEHGWLALGASTSDWRAPGRKKVLHATSNKQFVVLVLTGGSMVLFSLDSLGTLVESGTIDLGREAACLTLSPPSYSTPFVAVGDWQNTVSLYALDGFARLSMQALPGAPSSLCMVENQLHVGLHTGVTLRLSVRAHQGALSGEPIARFVGTEPVRLRAVVVAGKPAVLALSTRAWLCTNDAITGRHAMAPLAYSAPLLAAAPFASESCPEGIVAVAEKSLRILTVGTVVANRMFTCVRTPLRFTPRRLVPLQPAVHSSGPEISADGTSAAVGVIRPKSSLFAVIESEQQSERYGDLDAEELKKREEADRKYGRELKGEGKWASCVRIIDASSGETKSVVELEEDESATCVATVSFGGNLHVVVGTVKGMVMLGPNRKVGPSSLRTYRVVGDGSLELLHVTDLGVADGIPGAAVAFADGTMLLVGVGNVLRLYDLGKKRLLRKCETRALPGAIVKLAVMHGDRRIIVGDRTESIHFVSYVVEENRFLVFADDTVPRCVTALAVIDYETVIVADKFANLAILRVGEDAVDDVGEEAAGGGYGGTTKLKIVAQFHVGDIVTSLTRTSLSAGGADVIVYVTVSGGVGALVPFVSRDDAEFFGGLETGLRGLGSLCGRDHSAWRSAYFPVKGVIDGDLVEEWFGLEEGVKEEIAQGLEREVEEVERKIEEIRSLRIL